jgi:hypothetical protein
VTPAVAICTRVMYQVRCVLCEISDFHGIDLENFFLLGIYSVLQVIYHIATLVMNYQPLEIKVLCFLEMSKYVKIPAAQCATPEDQNPQDVQYKERRINKESKSNM